MRVVRIRLVTSVIIMVMYKSFGVCINNKYSQSSTFVVAMFVCLVMYWQNIL